jgi:hypothetical protein
VLTDVADREQPQRAAHAQQVSDRKADLGPELEVAKGVQRIVGRRVGRRRAVDQRREQLEHLQRGPADGQLLAILLDGVAVVEEAVTRVAVDGDLQAHGTRLADARIVDEHAAAAAAPRAVRAVP